MRFEKLRHGVRVCDGEGLIAQYRAMKKIVSAKDKLYEADRDIAEGFVDPCGNMRARIRDKDEIWRSNC